MGSHPGVINPENGTSRAISPSQEIADVRSALYAAANSMMTRAAAWSTLKAWGAKLIQAKGRRRGLVAVARKLAVIMHRMWVDGTPFFHGALEGPK